MVRSGNKPPCFTNHRLKNTAWPHPYAGQTPAPGSMSEAGGSDWLGECPVNFFNFPRGPMPLAEEIVAAIIANEPDVWSPRDNSALLKRLKEREPRFNALSGSDPITPADVFAEPGQRR